MSHSPDSPGPSSVRSSSRSSSETHQHRHPPDSISASDSTSSPQLRPPSLPRSSESDIRTVPLDISSIDQIEPKQSIESPHSDGRRHSQETHFDGSSQEPHLPPESSAESDHHGEDGESDHQEKLNGSTVAPSLENRSETKGQLSDQTNFLPKKQVIVIFAGLSCALFIALLDQTIVSTALPTITRAFGAGSDAAWLSTSYLLTSTAASPLYGRFSDIFGRKVCLIFSLTVFLIGSVLCAVAQSMTQLIAFRAIAGIGGGGIVTLVMVVVSDVVSLRERGTYQGFLGVVVAISNSGGPLVGGALAGAGWRWCFIIAIPIIVVALVAVIFLLPLKKVEGSLKSKLAHVDYLGVLLVLVGTVLLLLGLNWGGQTYPWDSPKVLGTLISGVVVFVIFGFVEAKLVALPLVPMGLFKNRTVASVLLQTICSGGIFYLLLFFVPQYTQVVKGYSGLLAGVCLIPLMAIQAISSTTAGILVSKTGKYKAFIVCGFAIFAIGVGLLALLDVNTPIGEVIAFLILSGFGAGGTLQTTLVAAQNAVDRKDLAVVTSTRNFVRLFGGTLALAASYTILNSTVRNQLKGVDESIVQAVISDATSIRTGNYDPALRARLLSAYVTAFRNVFYFGLALILVAFLLTLIFLEEFPLDRADDMQKKEEGKQWVEERKQRKKRATQPADVEQGVADKA